MFNAWLDNRLDNIPGDIFDENLNFIDKNKEIESLMDYLYVCYDVEISDSTASAILDEYQKGEQKNAQNGQWSENSYRMQCAIKELLNH